jgi:hypothetical protein
MQLRQILTDRLGQHVPKSGLLLASYKQLCSSETVQLQLVGDDHGLD